jgi:hypothetical protein
MTIMVVHIPTNPVAEAAHDRPHANDHIEDIDQPPGIGVEPIDDIDRCQSTVAATLAQKQSAHRPKNSHGAARVAQCV